VLSTGVKGAAGEVGAKEKLPPPWPVEGGWRAPLAGLTAGVSRSVSSGLWLGTWGNAVGGAGLKLPPPVGEARAAGGEEEGRVALFDDVSSANRLRQTVTAYVRLGILASFILREGESRPDHQASNVVTFATFVNVNLGCPCPRHPLRSKTS
jgi:hypothetical protein